jgi:8-oxo-dGTP diphosphatase
VYVARAAGLPVAADDARDARIADPADPGLQLAFDHRRILDDYLEYRASGRRTPLRG